MATAEVLLDAPGAKPEDAMANEMFADACTAIKEDLHTEALLYDALPGGYREYLMADLGLQDTANMLVMRLAHATKPAALESARKTMCEKSEPIIRGLGQLSLV